jgi:hypothetical protein
VRKLAATQARKITLREGGRIARNECGIIRRFRVLVLASQVRSEEKHKDTKIHMQDTGRVNGKLETDPDGA